ncbi:hypothetical protein ACFX2A_000139 [Malus domestica]
MGKYVITFESPEYYIALKMGTRTMIILNDAKLVHEALIEKGTANQVATIMHVEMYVWEDRDCEPRKLLLLGQFCQ